MALVRSLVSALVEDQVRSLVGFEEFDPASLFASGEQGAWYDPSDLTTLYQDSAGTTPVTADGDPVGLMMDKSGNGNHASQATSASRPVYRTDGALHWLEFDGVDDWFGFAVPASGIFDILVSYMPEETETAYVLFNKSGSPFLYAAFSSDTSTSIDGGSGAPSYAINGNAFTGSTRADLFTASGVGAWVVSDITGFDIAGYGQTMRFSGYTISELLAGRFGGMILRSTMAASEKDSARNYLMQLSGVTL